MEGEMDQYVDPWICQAEGKEENYSEKMTALSQGKQVTVHVHC